MSAGVQGAGNTRRDPASSGSNHSNHQRWAEVGFLVFFFFPPHLFLLGGVGWRYRHLLLGLKGAGRPESQDVSHRWLRCHGHHPLNSGWSRSLSLKCEKTNETNIQNGYVELIRPTPPPQEHSTFFYKLKLLFWIFTMSLNGSIKSNTHLRLLLQRCSSCDASQPIQFYFRCNAMKQW